MTHEFIKDKWYNNNKVIYQIIKYTLNRELALLSPKWSSKHLALRYLKCHNIQHFKAIREWIGEIRNKSDFNYYYSVARYKNGIYDQSFNHLKRKKINMEWKADALKNTQGYNLFIDIDLSSHNKQEISTGVESVQSIHKELNKYRIRHDIVFSGQGFHIKVNEMQMPKLSPFPDKPNNMYNQCFKIAQYFHDNHTEMVDLVIYDSMRLCKLPFSLALFKELPLVVTPLDDKMLNNFSLDMVTPENILLNYDFKTPKTFNNTCVSIDYMSKFIKDKIN